MGYGQKEIKDVPLSEGSKLTISAKAETVNNVTFSIVPTVDLKGKEVDVEFPYTIKVAPFNQKTFKDNLLVFLGEAEEYQTKNELLQNLLDFLTGKTDKIEYTEKLFSVINNVFTEEEKKAAFNDKSIMRGNIKKKFPKNKDEPMDSVLKDNLIKILEPKLKLRASDLLDGDFNEALNAMNTKSGENYYRGKSQVDDRLITLYRYFNDQIILLFEYDTEPVAGTLYYNKRIEGVQFFTNRSYELYFKNKVGNYHKLVKKLYKIWNDRASVDKPNIDPDSIRLMTNKKFRRDSIVQSTKRKIELLKENLGQTKSFEEIEEIAKNTDQEIFKGITFSEIKRILKQTISNEDLERYEKITPEYARELEPEMKKESNSVDKFGLEEISILVAKNKNEKNKAIRTYNDRLTKNQTDEIFDKLNQPKNRQKLLIYREIQKYFTKNHIEYNQTYVENPKLFYDRFVDIAYNFRAFNRDKRKKFIYQKILNHKNKEVYDSIAKYLPHYERLQTTRKEDSIKREYLFVKKELIESIDEYTQLLRQSYREVFGYDHYDFRTTCDTEDLLARAFKFYAEVDPNTKNKQKQFPDLKAKVKYLGDKTQEDPYLKPFVDYYYAYLKLKRDNHGLIKDIGETKAKLLEFSRRHGDIVITNDSYDENLVFNLKYQNLDELICEYNSISRSQENFFERAEKDLVKRRENIEKEMNKLEKSMQEQLLKAPLWNVEASHIQLDFNDGFAERISLFGKVFGIGPS